MARRVAPGWPQVRSPLLVCSLVTRWRSLDVAAANLTAADESSSCDAVAAVCAAAATAKCDDPAIACLLLIGMLP